MTDFIQNDKQVLEEKITTGVAQSSRESLANEAFSEGIKGVRGGAAGHGRASHATSDRGRLRRCPPTLTGRNSTP